MKATRISALGFLIAQTIVSGMLFAAPITVLAQSGLPSNGGSGLPSNGGSGLPANGGSGGGTRTIQNPLNNINSITQFVSALLKAVIAIGIPIAILFIVLAGFKFIAAQGSPDKLSEARTNFIYVVIGIAIFIGASALAELVMATLRQVGVSV